MRNPEPSHIGTYFRLLVAADTLGRLGRRDEAALVQLAAGLLHDDAEYDGACPDCGCRESVHNENLGIDFCAGCHGAPPPGSRTP